MGLNLKKVELWLPLNYQEIAAYTQKVYDVTQLTE